MNRERLGEFFRSWNEWANVGQTPYGYVRFSRQSMGDVEEIEKMTDEQLVKEWKGLVAMNHIYGQVSLNELQRISLLEMEMDSRGKRGKRSFDGLGKWAEEEKREFDKHPPW